jgi:hypothetical protein
VDNSHAAGSPDAVYPHCICIVFARPARRYDHGVRVRVYTLRSRGRRIARADANEGVPGDLRMYSIAHGSEMHSVARLCHRADRSSNDRELLPPLYAPKLVAVGDASLLLRGFQSIDGAAYVQEWRCVIERPVAFE